MYNDNLEKIFKELNEAKTKIGDISKTAQEK